MKSILTKMEWFESLNRDDYEWDSEVSCTCRDSIKWSCVSYKLDDWIDKHYKECYLNKLEYE